MQRSLAILLAAPVLAMTTSLASAQSASTTRIITDEHYAPATVAIENGVRVIRVLPPETRVIVNPGGETPLALSYNDTRVYERRSVRARHHHSHTHDVRRLRGFITHSNVGTGRY